ncbi:hypothetical protein [Marinimicrobium sp. ARAG 43.8]|uniref:hypothetical protein n=1 Tax=Marinimicrobium sp. ARAG 43.8 TaxID=3418719 RepID=UPI003CFB9951
MSRTTFIPGNHVDTNFEKTGPLREKLLGEITRFERQLNALKGSEQPVDFGMMQTYKELIHSRREMLDQLPPAF